MNLVREKIHADGVKFVSKYGVYPTRLLWRNNGAIQGRRNLRSDLELVAHEQSIRSCILSSCVLACTTANRSRENPSAVTAIANLAPFGSPYALLLENHVPGSNY